MASTDTEPTDPSVSVIIVTYRSADFVDEVLTALRSQRPSPDEVIVVDNASPDDTRTVLDGFDVTRIDLAENIGFAAGCHMGAEAASGSVLVFLGHDSVPEPGWLEPLVAAANRDDVGAAMATLVDHEQPDVFNTSGGHLNYVGLAWVSDLGEPVPDSEPELVDVAFPSGSALAIRRDVWERFGGFRPDLFMYLEDTDLGWRLRLAGLRTVRATRSRVRHRYDFSRTASKMFWLERNRWLMLRTNYRRSTLAVLSPALVITELGVLVVALRDRWLGTKLRAARAAIGHRTPESITRRAEAAGFTVGDAAMLETMDRGIGTVRQVRAPRGSGLVDAVLGAWLRLCLPLVRFFDRR